MLTESPKTHRARKGPFRLTAANQQPGRKIGAKDLRLSRSSARPPLRNFALRSGRLQLVIPSAGALFDGTLKFLASVDAEVKRQTNRRYSGRIPSIDGVVVTFQRQSSITTILDNGNADVGIVGRDRFLESRQEDGDLKTLVPDLQFGHSSLVIAVPISWRDIRNVHDLADRASDLNAGGQPIRIATKYPRLVRRYLQLQGFTYFDLVEVDGALEAAPRLGYADAIADISDTGNTLRENGLRPLFDGVVTESSAIMIGNAATLVASEGKMDAVKRLLERIEASLTAREFRRVTANVRGEKEDEVANRIIEACGPGMAGLAGPTIAKVWSADDSNWFGVSLVVPRDKVQYVVDLLRQNGGGTATVSQLPFIYRPTCQLYENLLREFAASKTAD